MALVDDYAADKLPARPQGRDLDADELASLAEEIAARPELWEPFVEHDPSERHYRSLHADQHLGVWVICWMKGHDTGFHDHDVSSVGVAVASGTIREERPVWGGSPRQINAHAGESFHLDETEIHRMVAVTDDLVVTIHAYSPPLQRMGMYVRDGDGYLHRRPVRWDQRLDAGLGLLRRIDSREGMRISAPGTSTRLSRGLRSRVRGR